jgi:cytochrome c-type biogenesis protein CcmH/NrfG
MVFDIASTQEEQLLQATKDRPTDARAWKALGRYYYGRRDKARMIQAYRKGVELDPADTALKDWLDKVSR